MNRIAALFVVGALVAVQSATGAIVEGNIETSIRPIVTLRYSGRVGGSDTTRTAVGILDTGDTRDTYSRDTASVIGVLPTTPMHTDPPWSRTHNRGATAMQTVTTGGWLGATLNPPELTSVAIAGTDPAVRAGDNAHIFTLADTTRTDPGTGAALSRLYYRDFNGSFSENHISMPHMSQVAPTNSNRVAFVDPINGTPIPFGYDNVTGGNGRGLGGASLPLDQRASSVSFFTGSDDRVPQPFRNTNPGFVHFVEMTPMEFATTTMTPAPANAVVNAALPAGVTRRLTLTVANADGPNVAGLVPHGSFGGLDPPYRPIDAAGTTLFGVTNFVYEVNNASLAIGGMENPNGFARADGSVQVVVQQEDGTVLRVGQTIPLPSQAPRPCGRSDIPGLIADTGMQLMDTGAPTTTRGGAGAITGTDELNKAGQFWDFSPNGGGGANPNRGRLTLIAPTGTFVRQQRGEGMLFSVDSDSKGLERSAVDQEKRFGAIPQIQPGAATVTTAGAVANEAAGTVFRSHLTGSNATYIDEAATGLDRGPADVINAFSLGSDTIVQGSQLFFSIDRASAGLPGTESEAQALLGQQAADIFMVPLGQPSPSRRPGPNRLHINQEVQGLGPNAGPTFAATGSLTDRVDNMNGFDSFTQFALPPDSLSNLDSPIIEENDDGTAARPRVGDDRYGTGGNFDLYFSLTGSEDILRDKKGTVFADGTAHIGLAANDDIDALALFRPSVKPGVRGADDLGKGLAVIVPEEDRLPNGDGAKTYDPSDAFAGIDAFLAPPDAPPVSDLALFSLTPGSPSLFALGLSPADVFITDFDGTWALFGSAESLGLEHLVGPGGQTDPFLDDNLDALDSLAFLVIPEPSALILCLFGIAGFGLTRRRSA